MAFQSNDIHVYIVDCSFDKPTFIKTWLDR